MKGCVVSRFHMHIGETSISCTGHTSHCNTKLNSLVLVSALLGWAHTQIAMKMEQPRSDSIQKHTPTLNKCESRQQPGHGTTITTEHFQEMYTVWLFWDWYAVPLFSTEYTILKLCKHDKQVYKFYLLFFLIKIKRPTARAKPPFLISCHGDSKDVSGNSSWIICVRTSREVKEKTLMKASLRY